MTVSDAIFLALAWSLTLYLAYGWGRQRGWRRRATKANADNRNHDVIISTLLEQLGKHGGIPALHEAMVAVPVALVDDVVKQVEVIELEHLYRSRPAKEQER